MPPPFTPSGARVHVPTCFPGPARLRPSNGDSPRRMHQLSQQSPPVRLYDAYGRSSAYGLQVHLAALTESESARFAGSEQRAFPARDMVTAHRGQGLPPAPAVRLPARNGKLAGIPPFRYQGKAALTGTRSMSVKRRVPNMRFAPCFDRGMSTEKVSPETEFRHRYRALRNNPGRPGASAPSRDP